MSVLGMEQEIKWVKDKLKKLGHAISECFDETEFDLSTELEELESSVEDLIDECEDTISSIQDL